MEEPAGEDGSECSPESDREKDAKKNKTHDESIKHYSCDKKKGDEEEERREDEPLSLKWPDTHRKQAAFLFLLPIVFPLWLTVPDVRRQVSQRHISEIIDALNQLCIFVFA